MTEDFRIPRFISSKLLQVEELILLAGTWWYSSLTLMSKIYITVLCVISQILIHIIKDDNKKQYIFEDFIFVWMINICMGIAYRNMYISLVCSLFYYMKSIHFRNKHLVLGVTLVNIATIVSGLYITIPETIVTFDLFITFFVCVCLILVAIVTIQLISQINAMIEDAIEQETSLDDLLYLVENKVKEAEFANKAKGNFLANMSHEIRTPINAVLGMDKIILRESKETNIRKYAKDIESSGRTLLSLINDILDFSKIESGKMELVCGEYDLSSIINDVVNMIRPKTVDKNLEFLLEVDENIPCKLYGDDVRIRQVIINLLTNAVKYTHKGSVKLTVDVKRTGEDALLCFSIKDTGIGIKEEDISKLSEEFVRIEESRNKNIEGTGLGMNIVISLLQLMGSKVEVNSAYGEGSEFRFAIVQPIIDERPIGKISERLMNVEDVEDYVVSFCIPDCRLLVVDDNAMNRTVFTNLLKEMQCPIDEAESGKECLELVEKEKYDIIFMDHMMPEMDGIETYKHMKQKGDYLNADTPVIILTANAISGAREEYLSVGFNDYLSKPIDADKLEAMIGNVIPEEKKKKATKRKEEEKETQKIEIDLPFIDGIDWENAMQRLKSEKLLQDSIDGFSLTAKSDMNTLKAMYSRINETQTEDAFSAYRIQVHSMKSNVATIGANHVAGLAKYLEYAARDLDFITIENLMPLFEREWNSLKQCIDEAFGKNDDSVDEGKSEISSEELLDFLDLLLTAVEEFDLDRTDAIMDELSEHSYPTNQKELINDLKVAAKNMDEEECSAIVGRLRETISG